MPKSPISLALIELSSIAVGYAVADALVKAARVTLHDVAPVSPGKLYVLFSGGVAELELARAAGLERAGADLIDDLLLPRVDPQVVALLSESVSRHPCDALGLLECSTVASGLLAADAAAKAAEVQLLDMRLARGIGGRTVILLTGTVADVETALEAGCRGGERDRATVRPVLISGMHEDLRQFLLGQWGSPD